MFHFRKSLFAQSCSAKFSPVRLSAAKKLTMVTMLLCELVANERTFSFWLLSRCGYIIETFVDNVK